MTPQTWFLMQRADTPFLQPQGESASWQTDAVQGWRTLNPAIANGRSFSHISLKKQTKKKSSPGLKGEKTSPYKSPRTRRHPNFYCTWWSLWFSQFTSFKFQENPLLCFSFSLSKNSMCPRPMRNGLFLQPRMRLPGLWKNMSISHRQEQGDSQGLLASDQAQIRKWSIFYGWSRSLVVSQKGGILLKQAHYFLPITSLWAPGWQSRGEGKNSNGYQQQGCETISSHRFRNSPLLLFSEQSAVPFKTQNKTKQKVQIS